MDRLEYDDPNLHPKEEEVTKYRNVKIYDGDEKTATFVNGDLVLTSHRLIFVQPASASKNSLSLPLHYLVYVEEEKAHSFNFSRSRKVLLHLSETLPGKNPGPIEESNHNFLRLSFKDGFDGAFLTLFNNVMQDRKWEKYSLTSTTLPGAPPPVQLPGRNIRAGIVGIERQIQAKHKANDESISLAFEDLSKLMSMAKGMVQLSKNISDKIKETQGEISDDETVHFKSYLLSLGIEDPVTRDNSRSESQYHKNLAKQISTTLQEQIKEIGGMMTLPEAYCRVNRARGLDMLSPDDMLKSCQLMTTLDLPLTLKKFESGVQVLHLNTHKESIIKTTTQAVRDNGSFTAEELAQTLGTAVLLAREQLLLSESEGMICRDDTIEGLRFYPNLLLYKI
ncbi:vacuolar protein-sorting-associated protein 36 [Neocloeon triangulifer]|uniref:vacuolar protein-sorting-associated protein 36 n=1 Tax=Neocloeon triangulifer TaxID=2078957 RepID=UPI00286F23EA|nr:vacuolar protein-sorting-associated protein 36 [Neocloeon triangulifer]XP_059481595.1 vacuolar protein-sorting-associated protein 36 [Neocloeon triangulifer]